MDPVTHALSGAIIYQMGFKRKAALFVVLFSAIAPDLDYITRLWGIDIFLRYHRGITHGILALGLFPLIMAFIFRNKGGFLYYYCLSFVAYAAHLLLDLSNQYGTRILSPLDWNAYSFDITFIIDLYITIGLLLGVILCIKNKNRAVAIALCTIILLVGYIGGRAYLQGQVKQFLKTKIDANIYKLYPLPNGFLRWWFVTKTENEAQTGLADIFLQKVFIYEKYNLVNNDPAVAEAEKNRIIQNFLYFARQPHVEVKRAQNTTIVTWRELSYSFLPGDKFAAKVIMDRNGKIIESRIGF
jgi:inner membrane protein